MNKIYLVRHGENIANLTKEFSYKRVDYSLTEKGVLQAKQTAEYFKPKQIDSIYSSPLKRAIETSEHIAKVKNITFSIIEEFRELNVGSLEGMKPNKENWNKFYKVTKEWLAGNTKEAFPDGESLEMLIERFKSGLIKIARDLNNQTIVIVGHGGIFTNGIIELLQVKNKQAFYDQDNHNCSISEFNINITNNNGMYLELLSWASVSHLSGEAAQFVQSLPAE